jgi:DNA-binding MarR family transcriptional regulator
MNSTGVQAWVAMQQGMRAMDAVARLWGRQVSLSPVEVMLVLMLAEGGVRSGSELATLSGRTRQQVQRSLEALEKRELVCAATHSPLGKVQGWRLTARGEKKLERLNRRIALWEQLVATRVELGQVIEVNQRLVSALIGRPLDEGLVQGLRIPAEMVDDWNLVFFREALAAMEDAVPVASEPLDLEPNSTQDPKSERQARARERVREAEQADRQSVHDHWRSLWR